ncbi:hypothetical protein SCAR479_01164 [Seiridium cardinale]|uniref:Ubiquitin 3 binding protein But2 C-terminal domain-containing protein n=1 Tax=Seiridium cardinale TaxID=138064 RepID=A0ABR2Y7W5_9PEZI
MYFTANVVSALAIVGLASAAPSKRAPCLEQPPSSIGFPINYNISTTFSPAASFQIPPNSAGPCTLVAKFPAGYPITSSGADLVNVRATNGNAPGSLVGTLRFQSAPNTATQTVINSFACQDVMAYQLEIADGGQGWVAFQEVQGAGLFMEVGDSC